MRLITTIDLFIYISIVKQTILIVILRSCHQRTHVRMSESKRLFVGNLPDDISDAEVRSQFKNYGQITSLEIKSKKAADGSVISTFAFVDLVVSPSQLSQCNYPSLKNNNHKYV